MNQLKLMQNLSSMRMIFSVVFFICLLGQYKTLEAMTPRTKRNIAVGAGATAVAGGALYYGLSSPTSNPASSSVPPQTSPVELPPERPSVGTPTPTSTATVEGETLLDKFARVVSDLKRRLGLQVDNGAKSVIKPSQQSAPPVNQPSATKAEPNIFDVMFRKPKFNETKAKVQKILTQQSKTTKEVSTPKLRYVDQFKGFVNNFYESGIVKFFTSRLPSSAQEVYASNSLVRGGTVVGLGLLGSYVLYKMAFKPYVYKPIYEKLKNFTQGNPQVGSFLVVERSEGVGKDRIVTVSYKFSKTNHYVFTGRVDKDNNVRGDVHFYRLDDEDKGISHYAAARKGFKKYMNVKEPSYFNWVRTYIKQDLDISYSNKDLNDVLKSAATHSDKGEKEQYNLDFKNIIIRLKAAEAK